MKKNKKKSKVINNFWMDMDFAIDGPITNTIFKGRINFSGPDVKYGVADYELPDVHWNNINKENTVPQLKKLIESSLKEEGYIPKFSDSDYNDMFESITAYLKLFQNTITNYMERVLLNERGNSPIKITEEEANSCENGCVPDTIKEKLKDYVMNNNSIPDEKRDQILSDLENENIELNNFKNRVLH